MSKYLHRILYFIQNIFGSEYFGFIHGHYYLDNKELMIIRNLVGIENQNIIEEYEEAFSKLIGEGSCVSYAAGRMGFYELMKTQGIKQGDEIILLGATCAVMVNAVIKLEATPVYSDIDPETFGSSAINIKKLITPKTKMIVAQHSFGIPCNIKPIVDLAKSLNIFLLEDCALSLGSIVNGVTLGNFGDAALFSTDHSKPINTLTGGIIYTNNKSLIVKLKNSQNSMLSLSLNKQKAIWKRVLLEKKYCNPSNYYKLKLIDRFISIKNKLFNIQGPFLTDDFNIEQKSNYPYPAKMPTFLALIGLLEIKRWPETSRNRCYILSEILNSMSKMNKNNLLPSAYFDNNLQIIPLRFAWQQNNGKQIRNSLNHFIRTSWIWFMKPIISTNEPLKKYYYSKGSCPISESIGPDMINIPCNIPTKSIQILIKKLVKALK